MKKLVIVAAIALVALGSQAASFKWSAANVMDYAGTSTYSGDVTLYAIIDSTATVVDTSTMSSGKIIANQNVFASDSLVGGTTYQFYYTSTDASGNVFTSGTRSVLAQANSTAQVAFGSTGSWTAAVPEPTSGLMLVLGIAGLALKRKRS